MPRTLPLQKHYDQHCEGFDWFTNLHHITSHHSCFLDISPQHCGPCTFNYMMQAYMNSLSSHAKHVSLGTWRSCLFTSWVGLVDLITYNAGNPKPQWTYNTQWTLYVYVLFYYTCCTFALHQIVTYIWTCGWLQRIAILSNHYHF